MLKLLLQGNGREMDHNGLFCVSYAVNMVERLKISCGIILMSLQKCEKA